LASFDKDYAGMYGQQNIKFGTSLNYGNSQDKPSASGLTVGLGERMSRYILIVDPVETSTTFCIQEQEMTG